MIKKERALEIAKTLKEKYPNPKSELKYKNETQFVIAVVLSSQTTDKKVNEVANKLFREHKKWEDFAKADLNELQSKIRQVNFHRGKAKRIIQMSKMIVSEFGGKVPTDMKNLITLPGVARKSANVILTELWGKSEGIVVDTHVIRVSNRLGLTNHENAVKVEKDLMELVSKKYWKNISMSLVLHGRYVCKARKPECGKCELNKLCPSVSI